MKPEVVAMLVIAGVVYVGMVWLIDRQLSGKARSAFRYVAGALFAAGFFYAASTYAPKPARAVDVVKILVAALALTGVLYERDRARAGRPIARRWKRLVAVTLVTASAMLYMNGISYGYSKLFHRWDQYHYYMGSKYYPELGYGRLYRCSLVAQDDLGNTTYVDERGTSHAMDLAKEARNPEKKVRNLEGDNLLKPATDFLDDPELCRAHFSEERWQAYKEDVRFFRFESGQSWWDRMQTDHGYNPPPVWTVAGHFLSNLSPASVRTMQALASLDLLYLLAMFLAIAWAFGLRAAAVAAVFFGCQASAPSYWTLGAFLRQDWLFFFVFAMCLARKRWFKLAGAALVYAALLRIFPGLAVIGWLTVAGATLVRHGRLSRAQLQCLLGGTLAAAVLLGASVGVLGADAYTKFYKHTILVHDQTPLTNHMGLRVLVSHGVGFDASSGRMKYTKDPDATDPFEVWKRMRLDRYETYKPVSWALIAASLVGFVMVVRRVRSLWLAQSLGQIWIILLSQLTCYYYSFMIVVAPLTRHRRFLEPYVFGFAILTQLIWLSSRHGDDRYATLSAASLVFCYGLLWVFRPPALLRRAPPAPSRER